MTDLDREERSLVEAYHQGRLKPVALSSEEIAAYQEAARAVTRKDRRVNIRLSSQDLEELKVRAMQEGMPYQTLMASVLHKYLTGRLVAK